jgi:hypothetical protein
MTERAASARYVYLGGFLTDPALIGRPCDPVRRADGRCIVGKAGQLVRFGNGRLAIVLRRRLRVVR